MPTPDDSPEPDDATGRDPTEPAEDGMAPLINNTGADDAEGDDADAASG
jgi:hypothetical protein